ncbi:MAG TPA: thioredoxin [Bacteroidales bacterium]|jgi:thioredoxin 1|nr:thioredoxin [Bacteroidales bacterium]HRS19208.1 thioredoxin [Bacteroidales bacterium]
MAVEITEANYNEVVAQSDKLVMIDFWAEWCGPCRMVAPIVAELATEYEGKAVIGKCDVDENSEIAVKFSIRNIPTLLFVKNGEVVDKLVGAVPKAKIVEKLDAYL